MDHSIYQARWLLLPPVCLFGIVFVAGVLAG
jgi:hypothetical protein